jgi:SAM-dependent methyltransferase
MVKLVHNLALQLFNSPASMYTDCNMYRSLQATDDNFSIAHLNTIHVKTYDTLAEEYEARAPSYYATSNQALIPFINSLPTAGRVLDVGCGVGYTTALLAHAGFKVEGIDLSPNMVAHALHRNPTVTVTCGDFVGAPYHPESFDGILLFSFLHLFPKKEAAIVLDKVSEILKEKGMLFLTTSKATRPTEGIELKNDYTKPLSRYRKRWTESELERFIISSGYGIINQETVQDPYDKQWLGYLCQKVF